MTDGTLTVYLAQHPIFKGLKQEHIALIGSLAKLVSFRPEERVFEQDKPAAQVFIVREGSVTVEIPSIGGAPLPIQTLEGGAMLGWSWLVPPYRWAFDARANVASSVIAIDGERLRAACEADPQLGYELLKRVAALMAERLTAARAAAIRHYSGT
jgi:CRP/FNR family cyclic AMP-dependent transcriptional regulator